LVLNAKGGPSGVCDTIDLTAFGGNVTLTGSVAASASGDDILGSGSGGDLSIDANGAITSDATIDVGGGGVDGTAGSVDVSTLGDITVTAAIDASVPGSVGYSSMV